MYQGSNMSHTFRQSHQEAIQLSLFESKPVFIKRYGLENWYADTPQDQKKRIERYVDASLLELDSPRAFIWKAAERALKARDRELAISLCLEGFKAEGSDLDLHMVYSVLIEAHMAKGDNVRAKEYCLQELELFPAMAETLRRANGGDVPKEVPCRNILIDILVGVEEDYDAGFAMLDRFVELGLLSEEEKEYRTNSLRIHRLTRTFDSVFTLKRKDS
jgi:hypothetical protein